jgi:hypothetical protein
VKNLQANYAFCGIKGQCIVCGYALSDGCELIKHRKCHVFLRSLRNVCHAMVPGQPVHGYVKAERQFPTP